MRAVRLRVDALDSPLGLGDPSPRLSWNLEDGLAQTAFEIEAYVNGELAYSSGKLYSGSMHFDLPLQLHSRDEVRWEVTPYDEKGKRGETSSSSFEMSILSKEDFRAKWISGNYRPNKKKRYPVDCFKKEFDLPSVKKARLYITACGLYEARINGKKVGTYVLQPGHTDYRKRIQLQTYDVTPLLKEGANVIEVELADGYYRGSVGAWGLRNQYGTVTKLFAQLEVYGEDGKFIEVLSDRSWRWSNDGTIREADNKDGEVVDARLAPRYGGYAREAKEKVVPTASDNVAVVEKETFKPRLVVTPSGKRVLDFGQNIAGYVSFKIEGKAGKHLLLRFGERLDEQGEFTQKNIQCSGKKKATPLQRVDYTFKDGLNAYKTKFAVFGFRYVLVEGDADYKEEDFTAIAVHSDLEETLSFDSSNDLLNRFVEATRWSARNNQADVPTDCPTRERHGWTGDAQIFVGTASYLFNYLPFARKYVRDMVDEQKKNGCFRQISPRGGTDFYMAPMDGSAGWSDAGVLIPWRLYLFYGDERILKDNYEAMCRYAFYKASTLGKWYPTARRTGIEGRYRKWISNYGQSYGEWAEPTDVHPFEISDFVCPHPEETTAYLVYLLETMGEIARLLGKGVDATYFEAVANKARIGYRHLVKSKKHSLDTDRQAKLVRPLYFGLLGPKEEAFARKRLFEAMEHYGYRVGTGFLSTPFILDVLASIDLESAYRLLENEEIPGWLGMVKNGATTIWESWEGPLAQGGVASLDHYSKGAMCEWVFKAMCGLEVSGENSFRFAPRPGGHFSFAKVSYQSAYGLVEAGWEKKEGGYAYSFLVPANCTAELVLPDGRKETLGPGRHAR